jgi:hypothetical protein
MFEDEIRHILRDLLAATGAGSASIVILADDAATPADGVHAPLGGPAHLMVEMSAAARADETEWRTGLEHAARALRACARRWDRPLPALGVHVGIGHVTQRDRAMGRIVEFLKALANTEHCENTLVFRHGEVVASARPVDELARDRLPFIARQVDARARVAERTHGELAGDDVFAVSFWYGAYLVVYFAHPYAMDFVRHRARLVTRELADLLPLLELPPDAPATVLPIP